MLVAAGTPGIWTLTVLNPTHNHGPIIEKPRQVPHHKVRKGQIPAVPYDWPHDATLTPYTTALLIIDMQKDCMYILWLGHSIAHSLINSNQSVHRVDIWSSRVMTFQQLRRSFPNFSISYIHSALLGFPCIIHVRVSTPGVPLAPQ